MRLVSLFLCALILGSCARVTSSSALPAPIRAALPATKNFKPLHEFAGLDGAKPFASLVWFNNVFYGTTLFGGNSSACGAQGCGTVFSMTPSGTEAVIYNFQGNSDGENPFGGLTKVSGVLYGTTQAGGANNLGTVFTISPSGSKTVIYSFKGMPSDGKSPMTTLLSYNGKLYGTTEFGGANDDGTVFSITPSGKEKLLYSFRGQPDGAYPRSSLIAFAGTLYGTTEYGGTSSACSTYNPSGCGTVFSLSTSGQEAVLYSFQGQPDGSRPLSGLVNPGAGLLYGTTWGGGATGLGTVFQITPVGLATVIYSFAGAPDGANPFGGLTYYNGALYGTTSGGGGSSQCPPSGNGCGTVFSISLLGGEKVLYSFQGGADGASPQASLVAHSGNLFGSAAEGGQSCGNSSPGCGTIFRVIP